MLLKWSLGLCPTTALQQRSAAAISLPTPAVAHAEQEQCAAVLADRRTGFPSALPWNLTPSWIQATQKVRKTADTPADDERKTKWVCTCCGAPHHNAKKQACRMCGEETQPKPGPKAKSAPTLKGTATKNGATRIASSSDKEPSLIKPLQVPKQLAAFLARHGLKIHSAAVPEPTPAKEEWAPKKLEDMTTERIQAAHDALVSVGMPDSVIQPYEAVLKERRAKMDPNYDPSLRLEHLTAARNKLAKRREELQEDYDDQKAKLERTEQRLQETSQDLESLQTQPNHGRIERNRRRHTADKRSPHVSPRDPSSPAAAGRRARTTKRTEYVKYATTTAAASNTPMTTLRWHLRKELGPLAADKPQPAPKRACINNAARNADADGDEVL